MTTVPLSFFLSGATDTDRARCLSIWTRELLSLESSAEVSVHELASADAGSDVVTSLIGVHQPTEDDWFFLFTHSRQLVTRRSLCMAILIALRPAGLAKAQKAPGGIGSP